MGEVDVLIITALPEELQAVKSAASAGEDSQVGITAWVERGAGTPTPYSHGEYRCADGRLLRVALARPTRMGEASTGPIILSLAERLSPNCLAMSGVCAGNPNVVTLGDVIVAEIAYRYTEGKVTTEGFSGDQRQIPLRETWIRTAQELNASDLPSYGQLSTREKQLWLLERLLEGVDPQGHPGRRRYFNTRSWKASLRSLENSGLIELSTTAPNLTPAGRAYIEQALYNELDSPRHLPFEVKVGPIASGDAVIKDGTAWVELGKSVRTILGLEMEAATIANAAYRLEIPNWLVVKGVMDYADPRKSDRYKSFAARASAEVMFEILSKCLRNPHDDLVTVVEPLAAETKLDASWPGGQSSNPSEPEHRRPVRARPLVWIAGAALLLITSVLAWHPWLLDQTGGPPTTPTTAASANERPEVTASNTLQSALSSSTNSPSDSSYPVNVQTDPNKFDPTFPVGLQPLGRFLFPGVSDPNTLPRPPDDGVVRQAFHQWAVDNGGIDYGDGILQFSLSAQNDPVQIVGMRTVMDRRLDVEQGVLVSCECGEQLGVDHLDIFLDSETIEHTDEVGRTLPNTFSIDPGKTEVFSARVWSRECTCEWHLELSLIVAGKPATGRVDNNGKPFQIAGDSPQVSRALEPSYRYSGLSWILNR